MRNSPQARSPQSFRCYTDPELVVIRHHIACTLIGQTVDLLTGPEKIAHGVVTGVLNDAGVEKLIVDGIEYELNQVLTVTPPGFD
jgi:hypothetical protein